MRKVFVSIIAALIVCIGIQERRCTSLRQQRDQYKSNQESLLQGMAKYKVSDSLNAAKVIGLELTLKEYKRMHEHDLARVREMIKKNKLSAVAHVSTSTATRVETIVHDSIYLGDTLRCIDVTTKYLDIHGCATADNHFSGEITSRDYLTLTESYTRKRFLGFLWYTKKRYNREFGIVSSNPNTEILGYEVISICHR